MKIEDVEGIGPTFAEKLAAAGVGTTDALLDRAATSAGRDSFAELAQRNAANLATTFQELDAARPNWIRQIPGEATIAGWIAEADSLAKVVSH